MHRHAVPADVRLDHHDVPAADEAPHAAERLQCISHEHGRSERRLTCILGERRTRDRQLGKLRLLAGRRDAEVSHLTRALGRADPKAPLVPHRAADGGRARKHTERCAGAHEHFAPRRLPSGAGSRVLRVLRSALGCRRGAGLDFGLRLHPFLLALFSPSRQLVVRPMNLSRGAWAR